MAIINDLHPNELFKFATLRGPKRHKEGRENIGYVRHRIDELSPVELAAIEAGGTLLWTTLLTREGNPDIINLIKSDIESFKASAFYIDTEPEYEAKFPNLLRVINWIDSNKELMTGASFISNVESILGDTISNYVGSANYLENKYRLWDNVFALVYIPEKVEQITVFCKTLSILQIFERIDNGDPDLSTNKQMQDAYTAQVLVPGKILSLVSSMEKNPDAGIGDQPEPGENPASVQAKIKYGKYIAAIREIKNVTEKKLQSLKTQKSTYNERPLIGGSQNSGLNIAIPKQNETVFYVEIGQLTTLTKNTLVEFGYADNDKAEPNALLKSLRDASWTITQDFQAPTSKGAIRIGDSIIESDYFCIDMASEKNPCRVYDPKQYISKGSFYNSAQIADLLVTKQQLIKYDLGEVAHIETIMLGEQRTRDFRKLDRSETRIDTETETSSETERDAQSTERFDMEKESQKVVNQDLRINTGVDFSADFGTYQLGTSLDFTYGWSQQQSNREASNFSKTVTNRALQRIKERTRILKSVTLIHETEDKTGHTFDNIAGTDHINGVYRWVDKFYINKIINYGKRLMFEFTIPEPAAFYIFQKMQKPEPGLTIEKPIHPSKAKLSYTDTNGAPVEKFLTDFSIIDSTNYKYWASYYGADVPNYPEQYTFLSKAINLNVSGNKDASTTVNDLIVPNGYSAQHAFVIWEFISPPNNIFSSSNGNGIQIFVGNKKFLQGGSEITRGGWNEALTNTVGSNSYITNSQDIVPVSVKIWANNEDRDIHAIVNIQILCTLAIEGIADWQKKVYQAILDAYTQKMRAYEEWKNAQLAYSGFAIEGNNPEINRQIEKTELKKRCLEMFSGQRFDSFDAAVNGIQNESSYPEIQFLEAIKEGNMVKFFEQAFDWKNMAYIFYPYFYGRKNNWLTVNTLKDNDPVFENFLKAGYARVVVPARKEYEKLLTYYSLFVSINNYFGGSSGFPNQLFEMMGMGNNFTPGVENPLYVSIAEELMDAANLVEDVLPDGSNLFDTYVQKVPTNLVYLDLINTATPPYPGLPDNSTDPEIAPFI